MKRTLYSISEKSKVKMLFIVNIWKYCLQILIKYKYIYFYTIHRTAAQVCWTFLFLANQHKLYRRKKEKIELCTKYWLYANSMIFIIPKYNHIIHAFSSTANQPLHKPKLDIWTNIKNQIQKMVVRTCVDQIENEKKKKLFTVFKNIKIIVWAIYFPFI